MSIGTLGSKFDTLGLNKDVLGDLSDLTLIAEDFGESPDSDFATSLIEVGRKVLFQDDCMLRIGGSKSKVFEGRMYVLSDVLIVGKYKKRKKGKRTMSTIKGKTQDKIIFGQEDIMTKDDFDEDETKTQVSGVTGGGTLRQDGRTLKLKLWVTLTGSGTQVRDLNSDVDHGIKIIYTTKEVEEVDGEMEMVTNVDQTEVFFADKEEAHKFSRPIHNAIDDILAQELGDIDDMSLNGSFRTLGGNRSVSATLKAVEPVDDNTEVPPDNATARSVSTLRSGRARAHMKGKATTKRFQRSRNSGKNAAPLTLADLESKYKVKLTPKAQAEMAVFTVAFKQGKMGFALSSSGTHGVFVGKLEDNEMADLSGVTLGDRVVDIGGEVIPDDMNWKECIEIIKRKRGEKTPDDKPKPLLIKFARNREVEENIAKEKEKKKQAEKKQRVRNRKRDWKTKRDKNKGFGTRMKSLKDLENKYRNRGEAEKRQEACDGLFAKIIENTKGDKVERKCAFVLREIYDTEKKYVSTLYMLKDDYIDRLTKKQVPMTCKESAMIYNTKFCEHNVPVRNCKRESSRKKKLLSPDDKRVLFMNVEVIIQLNERLLHTLQSGLIKLAQKAEKERVGVKDILGVYSPAFLRLMPFYALYSQYASKYAKAMDRYQFLKETNQYFNEEMEAILKKKEVISLNSLLIAPITRLTKYPLLFRTLTDAMKPHLANLTKNIIAGKEGDLEELVKLVDDLEQTNVTVEKVASTVDFKVDEESKNDYLNEIYHELGGVKYIKEFFKPSRKFIDRYEEVCVVEKKKARKERVILLFNDLVIIASYRKGASKRTLTTSGRGTTRRTGKASTISKDDKTLLNTMSKKSSGKGRSFFNLTRRGNAPILKIEYLSEMKKVKSVAVAKKNAEGQSGVQLFLSTAAKERVETKKKKGKDVDDGPSVSKVEVFFQEERERNDFNDKVKDEKEKLKNKERGRKDAKVALTKARGHLKEARRRLAAKAKKHGNSAAALSQNRQNDLRAKLMEQRKKRSEKKI